MPSLELPAMSPAPLVPGASRAGNAVRWFPAVALAYAVLYSVVVVVRAEPQQARFETTGFLPLYLAAGIGVWAGSRRTGITRRESLGWCAVAMGWLLSLTGALGYLATSNPRVVFASDLLYRSYYPLLVIGFAMLSAPLSAHDARRRFWLEPAIVILAALTLSWHFVWGDDSVRSYLAQVSPIDGVVPYGEMAVLIAAGIMLVRPLDGRARRPLELLGLGAFAASIGDLILVRSDALGSLSLRVTGDVLLAASAVLFACAGMEVRRRKARSGRRIASTLPYTAIVTIGALIVGEILWGHEVPKSMQGLLLGAVALAGLVIARLVIAERDVRSQARARVAQEARFRALVQRSGEALLVMDDAGVVRYASESTARVFGVEAEQMLGETLERVGVLPGSALHRAVLDPVDGALVQWERTVDDVTRSFETVVADRRADPVVDGVVLTTRDASERVALERHLLQAQKLDALGLLAGGVAHDFNNLLAAIRANADLVRSAPHDDPSAEMAEIQRATERGAALCRQLLAIGRPGEGERTTLALEPVLREILPMLRRVLPSPIALTLVASDEAHIVHVDRSQVEVAMLNLVVNARDAISGEGSIAVKLACRTVQGDDLLVRDGVPAGRYVTVQVSDTGAGMSAATLERVFEPFFTTKGAAGTGLGLAMVYGMMKGVDGRAIVRSTPGAGTDVTLFFPLVDTAIAGGGSLDAGVATNSGRGRILVVDDERSVREAVSKWLSRHGFEVLVAVDGAEALELLDRESWRVDAILSDVSMPRLNGHALAARVHATHPQLPVVLMSGYESPAPDDRGTPGQDGAPYSVRLQKPFSLEVLTPLLSELRERGDTRVS